jgi:hypothetical protein
MTAVSTPAWRSVIAQLWRRTWGWSFAAFNVEQCAAAVGGVFANEALNGVGAEESSDSGGEDWFAAGAGSFVESGHTRHHRSAE